jgi:muconolactone delta-isomerase
MKFLVVRKPRFGTGRLATARLIREQKQRVAEAIKAGTIDCIYAFPGGGGNVLIVNADSAEQLNERIMATPLFLYSEYEIRPLTDYNQYMENVAAALERPGS